MLLPLFFAFLAGFTLVLGFLPVGIDNRPTLQLNIDDPLAGLKPPSAEDNKKKGLSALI